MPPLDLTPPFFSLGDISFPLIAKNLLFLGFVFVYAFALVVGASIFYHLRYFGIAADFKQRMLEWSFVAVNAVLFIFNAAILISIYGS